MKIGIVCPYAWDTPGGVGAHVHDLRLALMQLGHEALILAPAEDEDALPEYVTSGGRPISISSNGSVAKVNFGFGPVARARRWIKNGEFDVLHVHEPAGPTLSILSIWAARGPIVATWHSSLEANRRELSAMYPLVQTAMEKVRARIAVSEYARRSLVEYTGGDAVLIPNGVDCSRYAGDEPLPGFTRGSDTVMFLGRIDEPRKGLPLLLEAFPQVVARRPDARLLVAGPGDSKAVAASIDPWLAERVHFLGRVSEEDKARALHSADVYVAPNNGGESFGIILLEAMAAGAPVVASDIDAFARVLDEGRAGVLFGNNDAQSLADAVVGVLADPARGRALRAAGYARARQFDWDSVAGKVVDVYESVNPGGEKVAVDLRHQLIGKVSDIFGDDSGDRKDGASRKDAAEVKDASEGGRLLRRGRSADSRKAGAPATPGAPEPLEAAGETPQ